MLQRIKTDNLNDYFLDLGKRKVRGVYFGRINGYNENVRAFIKEYYEVARRNGVIIEGKIPNPDNRNLEYYNEIMGKSFQLNLGFITAALKRWLPRMNDAQRNNVGGSIYNTLMSLKQAGKTDSMINNAYIKFMCWLYYKFERIVHRLGNDRLPKILYEGEISNYELLLLDVLAGAGCDIVLLQYRGDENYKKVDPGSVRSDAILIPGAGAFPADFNLKSIQRDIQDAIMNERLYGPKSRFKNCTNAWITGNVLDDVRNSVALRGSEPDFFYNCFCRLNGAWDKATYQNDLYQLQLELRNTKRRLVIVNETIEQPSPEEIRNVHRQQTYQNVQQLLGDISSNLNWSSNLEMQKLYKAAFVDLLLEESKKPGVNVNRLTNKAVFLICWMKRYQSALFERWQMPEIAAFFHMGGCKNDNEELFLRFLGRLPVDVIIFNPNLNVPCCLKDPLLFETSFNYSLNIRQYPEQTGGLRIGTAAYQAEQELNTLIYTDTGLYRVQQFTKANTVPLHTMYEEIAILWDQELKYRPNFSEMDDVVNIPVIFSKVSGIKNGNQDQYWSDIKDLLTEDTTLIGAVPRITRTTNNPIKPFVNEFLKNGKLNRTKIKSHKAYQYGFLRDSMQEHLLDKIQTLIDQKLIAGTFQNGTEYNIVSTALNIDKETLRRLQNFDFTRKNPKLVYVITGETALSLEDTIYAAYMSLVGFDVVFFVPTGYQCIENNLNKRILEEHQVGPFVYDLTVPDFSTIQKPKSTLISRFFNRGK